MPTEILISVILDCEMPEFQKELDAKNMSCPVPVMKTKKMLRDMAAGDVLHVVATDPASVEDINILLESVDDTLIDSSESNGEYHFYIKRS